MSAPKMKAVQGMKTMTHRVRGTPQRSAKRPNIAAPIPPVPMAKPTIKPETIPRLLGMKNWPMTMDTVKEKINIKPARIKKKKDQTPELNRKRTKKGVARHRLTRTIFL